MGRSLHLAVLRVDRLADEAVQMAAPAAHPRRRAGGHHRALSVHIDRALRIKLDASADRGAAVRSRHSRPRAAVFAGYPQPRRRAKDADEPSAADISPLATV